MKTDRIVKYYEAMKRWEMLDYNVRIIKFELFTL